MTSIRIEKQDGIAIIWLDQPGERVNKISIELLDEFSAAMKTLTEDPQVKGAVLISKKSDNFIAGADIDRFLTMQSPGEAAALSRKGHGLLNQLAGSAKPVVAAIHGACLGGGLEVALACTARIASDDPCTVLGQPEVKLGLLPGGGGTQRLPRLVGLQRGLGLMLTGKNIYPKQAKRMGLVDYLVHPYGLLEAAKKMVMDFCEKPLKRKRRLSLVEKILEGTPLTRKIIYKKAREMVMRQTMGNYPAPLRIIECVEAGMEKGLSAGMAAEEEKFDSLVLSPQSRQLIHLFFNMNSKKKNPAREKVRPVQTVAVLGAGFMGAGIASVSAAAGMKVLLKDVSHEAVGKGEKTVWDEFSGKVKRGALSPFVRDQIFSRIHGRTDYKGFGAAELVVEAVFEDLKLKQEILAQVEAAVSENCIFASNTSSLPIKEIAKNARRPQQVVGMHYFSPVPRMPLLEIIETADTADWVTATAVEVGIRQGKTVIVVKDGPGFYTTRILAPLLHEALLILEEGAEIHQVDRDMKRYGFPVGPLTLLDEVGIDVGAHVSGGVLGEMFLSRGMSYSDTMIRLNAAGFKGRKNKTGFYRYEKPAFKWIGRKKKKQVNPKIYEFFGGSSRKTIVPAVIQDRLAFVMTNEAARALEEGILVSPHDGDLGAVLGLGFPPFLGGPFRNMDTIGIGNVVAKLKGLEETYGPRFAPAQMLVDMQKHNRRFYPE
ncbi:MAG: 3-hydroxyacyl-CoA dehydrogenase NAD-binding domain-containing protein [Desulfobacterales bacterium]|nr:3-hydroxyacyl-CoA dehydrogenase NAD-binding domain-containing protein [Desulfobacterales bacterium]